MAFAVFMGILYLMHHKSAGFYSHGCTEVRDGTCPASSTPSEHSLFPETAQPSKVCTEGPYGKHMEKYLFDLLFINGTL